MAGRHLWALALTVPLVLAGCLGGGSSSLLGDDPPPTQWDLSLGGCDAVAATVPVDQLRVDEELPQGFEPVDSSSTFGAEQGSGRTNLTLLTAACEDGALADEDVGIPSLALPLVRVEPVDAMEGTVDATFYGFTVHGEDPTLRRTLQDMGHAGNRSKVFANVTTTPTGSGADATVTGDDIRYRIRSGAGTPSDRYESFRVYHAGDRGLLVLDTTWQGAAPVDGGAELEVNEGSRLSKFMDEDREPAYGVTRPGADLAGAWHLVGGEGGPAE
jgi:hypothetical protein